MKQIYKDYLLTKRILVNNGECLETPENIATILTRLYNDYGIIITDRIDLVNRYTYADIEMQIGEKNVAPAFYRNFPAGVRVLSKEQLLADQLIHYMTTYGFGDFSEAGHSIFDEEEFRTLLTEKGEIKRFRAVTEEDAYNILKESCVDILSGTRPLNNTMYGIIREVYDDILSADENIIPFKFREVFSKIASKDTTMRILLDTRNSYFAQFMSITDIPKLVERMATTYHQTVNKLSLPNQDRKLLTKILDKKFENEKVIQDSMRECCEKKKLWCGLLHQIHYKPKTSAAIQFVNIMRGKENLSVLSQTEKLINNGYPDIAAGMMKAYKGAGFVLRNLNYLLSRCTNEDAVNKVFEALRGESNPIIALQLFNEYSLDKDNTARRSFSFSKYGLVKNHKETDDEMKRRKSFISNDMKKSALVNLHNIICDKYTGTINKKVYINENMKNIALPIYESASSMGIGSLPTGSRIPLNGKNVRAFTYWEKVNDIDLACFGINKDGTREEFSWRNMYGKQSEYITFSGDQTSGYNGGSEYFDINLNKFKDASPQTKYIIFTNNVFSGIDFNKCYCTAGFMLRENLESGEIYEPKTVNTSYGITAASTFAYLFAIDLETDEVVWLNIDMGSKSKVAGCTDMSFLDKYIYLAKSFNLYDLFTIAAAEIVDRPEDADIIVDDGMFKSDNVIHSCDIDKLIAILNLNYDFEKKD